MKNRKVYKNKNFEKFSTFFLQFFYNFLVISKIILPPRQMDIIISFQKADKCT